MSDGEGLDTRPVFNKLDWRWSWYGISFEDLPLLALPGFVTVTLAALFGFALSWTLVVTVAAAVFVIAMKWRKPAGYFECLLYGLLVPRRFSHKERDDELPPFPVPPCALSSRR